MKPCPVCDRPAVPAQAPFCSAGCRDRDLLKWLNEDYRVPVRERGEDALDSEEPAA